MKHRIVAAAIFILSMTTLLNAEDYRQWTETESGRQIEAMITDKKFDGSEAKLVMRNSKVFWIKAASLTEKDREYIKNWVKQVDHLSCRVVGKSKSGKRVKVMALAGEKPMKVAAYDYPNDKTPITKNLKAGEELEFEYDATDKYVVKAWSDGVLVDEEAWNKKSGL